MTSVLRNWLQKTFRGSRRRPAAARTAPATRNRANLTLEGLESRLVPTLPAVAPVDLTVLGRSGAINGAYFSNAAYGAGSGNIDSFLRIQGSTPDGPLGQTTQQGLNSDARPQFADAASASNYNHALALTALPTVVVNGVTYREFRLDINEANGNGQEYLSLDALQIYQSDSRLLSGFTGSSSATGTFTGPVGAQVRLAWNMDALADSWVALNANLSSGSGKGDLSVLVPDSAFDPALPYVTLYSAFGYTKNESGSTYRWQTDSGFEEWSVGVGSNGDPAPIGASTLTGTSFTDGNGNGVRDGGETALAGVRVYLDTDSNGRLDWTDANSNGQWDAGEGDPWTTTDASGTYTFTNLAAGLGEQSTYVVREVVPEGYRQTGPLDGSYATGVSGQTSAVTGATDSSITVTLATGSATYTLPAFGNQRLGTITVIKTANPQGSQAFTLTGSEGLGSFTLTDDGTGANTRTFQLAAGHYSLQEAALAGWSLTGLAVVETDGTTNSSGDLAQRLANLTLEAGEHITVTWTSTQQLPAYTFTKTADTALVTRAGTVVTYTYTLTNTGNVPLTGVTVTDAELGAVSTRGGGENSSQDTVLDVGETWTYTASYTVTQADLDRGGSLGGPATAQTSEAGLRTSDAPVAVQGSPALAVQMVADTSVATAVGQVITYTITVANTGNLSLTGVTLADPLVNNAVTLTGSGNGDAVLDVGETWTYTTTYALKQADVDAGTVTNTAAATAQDPTGATVRGTSAADTAVPQAPAMTLTKTGTWVDVNKDRGAQAGEYVDYVFSLANTGNVTLRSPSVTDPLFASLTAAGRGNGDANLDVGETWTWTARQVLTAADVAAGKVSGTANGVATPPVGPALSRTAAAVVNLPVLVGATDVSSQTTAQMCGVAFSRATNQFSGVLRVTNTGTATLTGMLKLVLKNVPAGVVFTSANVVTPTGGDPYVLVNVGTLKPGAYIDVAMKWVNPQNKTMTFGVQVLSGSF